MASLPATLPMVGGQTRFAGSLDKLEPQMGQAKAAALSDDLQSGDARVHAMAVENGSGMAELPPIVLRVPDLHASVHEEPTSPAAGWLSVSWKDWATSEVGFWIVIACGAIFALYLIAGSRSAPAVPLDPPGASSSPGVNGPTSRSTAAMTSPARTAQSAATERGVLPIATAEDPKAMPARHASGTTLERESRQLPQASLTGRILKPSTR